MAKYLFSYHGGTMPSTPEDGAKVMAAWTNWLGGLGDKAVDKGNPVGKSKTVGPDGVVTDNGGANPINGYSIIEAETIAAAMEIARACPQVSLHHGSVEVAELMSMSMSL